MPTPAASSAFGYGTSPPLHQRGANDALRPYGGPASGGWLGWWTVTRLANGIAGLSGWRRWLTAALLGMCATAALPPVHALPLLIVAFTGLVWLLDGARSHRAAFGIGWWFGIGFFLTGLYWVSIAFLVDAATFGWMIPFALFGLSAGLGLFTGAATLLARASGARGVGRVLALAVAWTALEWLRGVIFTPGRRRKRSARPHR
jgi:apolipoprotein N-acyltransferase